MLSTTINLQQKDQVTCVPTPRLEIELCGISMKNPLMLASGILGVTAETMKRVGRAGAGAVVTKSIGNRPRKGHKNPSLIEVPHGLLNAMGLPNPGIKDFVLEMEKLKGGELPVIGSVFGETPADYASCAEQMEDAGAAGIELNLSCPHAKGLGLELGSDPRMVTKIVTAVKKRVEVPVFAKLTPHTPDITGLGTAAASGGADALVAVNTVKAMSIDIIAARPVLGNVIGGYSGPALKPIGVRAVYELAKKIKIPIIGVGGVATGADAVEYMMAGASAVQVGSAVFYRGNDVFKKINDELKKFMKENDYGSIEDMVRKAHG